MVVRVRQAEQTAREAQERARMTEQRAQRLEARGHDQFWVVNREEIQLTDQELGRGGWAVVRVAKFRGFQWQPSVCTPSLSLTTTDSCL